MIDASKVERFDVTTEGFADDGGEYGAMEAYENGEYVTHADYLALAEEREGLLRQMERILRLLDKGITKWALIDDVTQFLRASESQPPAAQQKEGE